MAWMVLPRPMSSANSRQRFSTSACTPFALEGHQFAAPLQLHLAQTRRWGAENGPEPLRQRQTHVQDRVGLLGQTGRRRTTDCSEGLLHLPMNAEQTTAERPETDVSAFTCSSSKASASALVARRKGFKRVVPRTSPHRRAVGPQTRRAGGRPAREPANYPRRSDQCLPLLNPARPESGRRES